jgi:RNA polymerase sigma-70 factor, ECF subfamily
VASADSVGRHTALADRVADDQREHDDESGSRARAALGRVDLRALFEAHYGSIWRLLRRLGVPAAQLDDAAQEVFWVAARKLSLIEPGREHSFLYGVALRIASNLLRRERAAPRLGEFELTDLPDLGPSPEEKLEQNRARALLDDVLLRLPLELRSVFVLFELEGVPVKEIAELEEIPIGTAASRLRRAREEFSAATKRLRAVLQGPGGVR